MNENKRYYWIKLKTDFFNREEIDFLLSQDNGCKYIVLYQMLCLSTANNNGEMCNQIGEILIPYDVKKIVRDTKYFDFDTVTIALEMFKKLNLIYIQDNNVFRITNFESMVGSETSSTNRVRKFRERQKQLELKKTEILDLEKNNNETCETLQCNGDETFQCNADVTQDIDIRDKILEKREKEKDIYNKNIYNCHLRFKEKKESCLNCVKRYVCNLPTSQDFKIKYKTTVEDYTDNTIPLYYKDENGNEYWNGKLISDELLSDEEVLELEQRLNKITEV